MTACVTQTFAAALKSVGVEVPENCHKITISAYAHDTPMRIVFHLFDITNIYVKKVGASIISQDGSKMMAQEFFKLIREVVKLPDETTKFTITADLENVVTIDVSAAFPLEAVEALRGCKFESLPK